jgi:hypothetical protein
VAAAIGAPALPLDRRRASSRVAVSGAVPGSPVWLEATWLTPVGAIADSRGRAKLELWHDGQATVHCGGDQVEVTLRPDEWRDLQRTDQATDVDLPPRP